MSILKSVVPKPSRVMGWLVVTGTIAAIATSGVLGPAVAKTVAKTGDSGRSIPSVHTKQATSVEQEILAAHNRYRSQVGVKALTWSPTLADHARTWAEHLASIGDLEHSTDRKGEGENLASGTAGAYSATQLVDMWGGEKQYFNPHSAGLNINFGIKCQKRLYLFTSKHHSAITRYCSL